MHLSNGQFSSQPYLKLLGIITYTIKNKIMLRALVNGKESNHKFLDNALNKITLNMTLKSKHETLVNKYSNEKKALRDT